jgi:hypothetical protein
MRRPAAPREDETSRGLSAPYFALLQLAELPEGKREDPVERPAWYLLQKGSESMSKWPFIRVKGTGQVTEILPAVGRAMVAGGTAEWITAEEVRAAQKARGIVPCVARIFGTCRRRILRIPRGTDNRTPRKPLGHRIASYLGRMIGEFFRGLEGGVR